MNINKIILMGRLTADPELKVSSTNIPVTRFSIAVNRRAAKADDQSKPTADFFNCVAFRSQAEFVSKYFKKGSLIIVFGSVQFDTYKDANGIDRKSTTVMVSEVMFGESKSGGAARPAYDNTVSDAPAKEPEAFSNSVNSDFFSDVKDIEDELPF